MSQVQKFKKLLEIGFAVDFYEGKEKAICLHCFNWYSGSHFNDHLKHRQSAKCSKGECKQYSEYVLLLEQTPGLEYSLTAKYLDLSPRGKIITQRYSSFLFFQ